MRKSSCQEKRNGVPITKKECWRKEGKEKLKTTISSLGGGGKDRGGLISVCTKGVFGTRVIVVRGKKQQNDKKASSERRKNDLALCVKKEKVSNSPNRRRKKKFLGSLFTLILGGGGKKKKGTLA